MGDAKKVSDVADIVAKSANQAAPALDTATAAPSLTASAQPSGPAPVTFVANLYPNAAIALLDGNKVQFKRGAFTTADGNLIAQIKLVAHDHHIVTL